MFNPQVDSSNSNLKDLTEKLNQGIDIGVLAFLFNKSKYYIFLFFAISAVFVFIYLRYSQSIYESTAVLQINDANTASDILKINTGSENQNLLAEAIEQIRSKVFLKRVVERMDISINYFSEGTFKNNDLYHSSPFLIKINVKNQAIYGEKVYVELNNDLSGGTIRTINRNYVFVINDWLHTDDFDLNVYLNPKNTPEQIRTVFKENKALYLFTSVILMVMVLAKSLEVRTVNFDFSAAVTASLSATEK